jgi:hypothetical protein
MQGEGDCLLPATGKHTMSRPSEGSWHGGR